MNALIVKKGADVQLTKNFHISEFECPCDRCSITIVDLDHIDKLQKLRDKINLPMNVNSGWRCESHNKELPGSSDVSRHMVGDATDFEVCELSPLELFPLLDFNGIGIYNTFTHVDSRPYEQRAVWDETNYN